MKRIAMIAWLLTMVMAVPATVYAADPVAVVNVKEAMKATKHWKQALSALEKEKKTMEGSLEKERQALKEKFEGLKVQKDVLAPANYQVKVKELERDQQKLASQFMQSQQKLAMMEKGYAGQLIQRIELVVRNIAQKKRFLMIVDKGEQGSPNVLYMKKGTNITKEVIAGYESVFGDKPLQAPQMPTAAAQSAKK